MPKKFKLQSVLNYRQSLEDQAQQRLSETLQRKKEMQKELAFQRERMQRHDSQLRERQLEGMTVAEMELYEAPIRHCQRQIEQLQKQLVKLERQIEEEREELLSASRDRQIMEKLKEKQEAEYRREMERRERAILDEISLRDKGEKS